MTDTAAATLDRTEATAFRSIDSATGEPVGEPFAVHGPADVDAACAAAEAAFDTYRAIDREARAAFLEKIGEEIIAIGDPLIEAAMRESGLPRARLEGERGRTVGQLKLFAGVVRRGAYLGLRIDPARPRRRLRCVQLPARLLDSGWRHRLCARRRLPGGGEGASRPSADR